MIKLATVFSGIGAIEHALQRMNIENEIVFACDNGDVEILTKNIGMNLDVIDEELTELQGIIVNIKFDDEIESIYKNQLSDMLIQAKEEFCEISSSLLHLSIGNIDQIKTILKTITEMEGVKPIRIKEYKSFLNELKEGSNNQIKLKHLQLVLEVLNDYKKDNLLENLNIADKYNSSDQIQWEKVAELLYNEYQILESVNGKKLIRNVQDLSQRTSQLHEKINYLKVQKQLESFGTDWNARKNMLILYIWDKKNGTR